MLPFDADAEGSDYLDPFLMNISSSLEQATQMMKILMVEVPGKAPSKKPKAKALPKAQPKKKARAEACVTASAPVLSLNFDPLMEDVDSAEDVENPHDAAKSPKIYMDNIRSLIRGPFDVMLRHKISINGITGTMLTPTVRALLRYMYAHINDVSVKTEKWPAYKARLKTSFLISNSNVFGHDVLQQLARSRKADEIDIEALLRDITDPRVEDDAPEEKDVGQVDVHESVALGRRARKFARILRDETLMLGLTDFAMQSDLSHQHAWQMHDALRTLLKNTAVAKENATEGPETLRACCEFLTKALHELFDKDWLQSEVHNFNNADIVDQVDRLDMLC